MSEVRLIHGDCLDVLPTLEPGSVDAVCVDPPYGKRFHDGGVGGLASERWTNPAAPKFEGRKIRGDDRPDTRVCGDLARILKDGGALYLFSQWMTEATWIEAIRGAGLIVRNRMVWVKPFHGAGDLATTYGPQHESIIFATKGRHELRGPRDGDVWAEPVGANGCFRKGHLHPNQKPTRLIAHLLAKSAHPGCTIVDPYMGSGTTGVAAIRAGLNFIGIEIDPGYFEIARKRIEAEQDRHPLFDRTPRNDAPLPLFAGADA